MYALIVTTGSHGDVHPFLAVGRALLARGHECAVLTHLYFQRDVEAAGLKHLPLNTNVDLEAVMRHPDIFHHRRGGRLVLKMIFESTPAAVDSLRAVVAARRPDVIVTHHVCFGVRWLAEQQRIPYAVTVLAPLMWFSMHDPVPAMQYKPGGAWRTTLARTLLKLFRPFFVRVTDWQINKLRRRTGFPKARNLFFNDLHGGDANLAMWSPHFRDKLPDDPPQGVICGFPWYDRAAAQPVLEPELEEFLQASARAGEPPIIFSLGSAAVHTAGNFYELAAEACRRLNRRGILLTGRAEYAPRHLPPGVRAFAYAPFSLLLPRGGCTVQHGGIGSTAQALRAGRPMVAVPHAHDQFNNAVRCEKLGVARVVPRHQLTIKRLADALDHVLNDNHARERAGQFGALLATEDGGLAAAQTIERLAAAT